MFGALDISASALTAQRTRLNTIAANMANMGSTHDANGAYNPYRKRIPIFASGDPSTGSSQGVHVREIMLDDSPFKQKYMPSHPDADDKGYVNFPNIDGTTEQINAMEASRAYEANITAAEATKTMMGAAMRLLA